MTCGITETGTVPKLDQEWDCIDTAALEAYGISYGESHYDFIPQIGTRAGYAPGDTLKITTMAEGFLYVAAKVDALAANLLAVDGTTYFYLDVGVEDLGNGYYLIRVYYG